MAEAASRPDLIKRLKRIEGQVRGVQRMVDEDRACVDILEQLSAINEAVRRVSVLLAEQYAYQCLGTSESSEDQARKSRETITALIDTLMKAPR